MSQNERDQLLEHDYDGIQEYDNPMPRWWVYLFWATIAFSVVYAMNIGPIGSGKGRIADYEAELAAHRARHPDPEGGAVDAAKLAALVKDPAALALGQTTYTQNCAACHRADGGGMIGPNLTDDAWLHGGTLPEIHKTVEVGVLEKGMPAWGKMLKPDQIDAVVAYVASLHGTNPPNPKAPQGVPAAQ
ncbi:MAG TPA: cbb3-type cytochrome c oxidase N-terminal domain-containing protein [Gemmatimonadaceae bacterium]|nr:cbb3-type cytochrome c oxidase N-terminal domain-containing protein [Gemmatimonadaceae bacterium]